MRSGNVQIYLRICLLLLLTIALGTATSVAQGEPPFQFHGSHPTDTETVGTDKVGDATQAQLETAIRTGLQAVGVDVNAPGVADFITQQALGILASTEHAATIPFVTFGHTITRAANGTINGGTFTWEAPSVSLVPSNVSAMLFQHETGHQRILEDVERYAHTVSEQFFARIRGKVLTNAQVADLFNEITAELLFIQNLAGQLYDNATLQGRRGDLHQITIARRSFLAAKLVAPILPIPRPGPGT